MLPSSLSRGVTPDDHLLKPEDVLGIISIAPNDLTKENLQAIGGLVSKSQRQGYDLTGFHSALKQGTESLGGEDPKKTVKCCNRFGAANLPNEAMSYLKTPEQAETDKDVESLMLLSKASQSQYASSRKPELLEDAWRINQMVLALPEVKDEEKNKALQIAVSLAPKVREELGQTWMDESFTSNPKRGIQIIAGLAKQLSVARPNTAQVQRFESKA